LLALVALSAALVLPATATVRWLPTSRARRIVRAHYLTEDTEDGFPEVYPGGSWTDANWHTWLEVRMRALLVVARGKLRATLYERGRPIWRAPVGIGKPIIGTHGTSEHFLIPGRPSHRCIRVRNRAVRRLWRLMPIGTPLLIR
jgi:hypothetical protein